MEECQNPSLDVVGSIPTGNAIDIIDQLCFSSTMETDKLSAAEEARKLTLSAAEEARKLTQAAEQSNKIKAAEEARVREHERQQQHQQGVEKANDEFAGILDAISTKATAGHHSYVIEIYHWRSESGATASERGYVDRVKANLIANGFKVKDNYSSMEPFGSDPLFYHTVYNYSLIVSW